MQLQAAEALGMDPYWIVALNSLGVGAGKMISPQSLAIGMAAVQVTGAEGKLLSRVLPIAVVFVVLFHRSAFLWSAAETRSKGLFPTA